MNIRAIRVAGKMITKGWNGNDLAEKAGVAPNTISRIMTGSVKRPSLATLKKIADALEMPVEDIL